MSGRILVLRPGAIGDTLLTAPALTSLRRRFPGRQIQMAGNERALPVLAAMGLVDAWTTFDDPAVTGLFIPREPPPDDPFTPIDLAIAWCADPDGVLDRSLRLRGAREVVIARSRPAEDRPVHVARHLLSTLAPLRSASDPVLPFPSLRLPADAQATVASALTEAGLEAGRYVVVHPGSGSPSKNWPPERFAEVIGHLRSAHGLPALLLAGPADDEAVAKVQARLSSPTPVLADRPLTMLAEVLRRARAFLGNDSGLSHLAGLVDTPTLVLFGPTDPALWTPLGSRVRVIRHQPLDDLSVEAVLREADSLVS